MARARKQRALWAVTGHAYDSSAGGFRMLELTFKRVSLVDAAEKVAASVKHGADDDATYYTKKAACLRAATGSTEFFGGACDYEPAEFSVRWQANTSPVAKVSGWYAPHVEHADLSPHVAKAVARLAKLSEPSPQEAITALSAAPAVYVSDAWEHAPGDIGGALVSPLDKRTAEDDEQAA